jgi:hypothetical protein
MKSGGILAAFTCLFAAGCAQTQLKSDTHDLVGTIPGVIEGQVLEDLVIQQIHPEWIPGFATIATGTSQVVDQAGGQISAMLPAHVTETPQFSGQRQVTYAWGLVPVTDAKALHQIRDLLQIEISPNDKVKQWFDRDFAPQPNVDNAGKLVPAVETFQNNGGDIYAFYQRHSPATRPSKTISPKLGLSEQPLSQDDVVVYPPTIKYKDVVDDACCVQIGGDKPANSIDAGKYCGKQIWITDAERFVDFELLVLRAASTSGATISNPTGGGTKPQTVISLPPAGPQILLQ